MADLALSASPPMPWGAAFHAQQAAEKALKVLLTHHRTEFEKSHDMGYLLELCAPSEPQVVLIAPRAAKLTRYAIWARYPLPAANPTESEAVEALETAREVRDFVRRSLPPESSSAAEQTDM